MSHSGTKGLESARIIRILEVELVIASGRMKIIDPVMYCMSKIESDGPSLIPIATS